MQSFSLSPLFPTDEAWLSLFNDVENAEELREMTINGGLKACLVNASLIMDPFQILVAVNKALHHLKLGKLKTRSLYSEILFNLSPTGQINESMKTFGITDTSTSVLVVVIGSKADAETALALIQGKAVNLSTLKDGIDWTKLKNIYKITDSEETRALQSVITTMATKDVK